MAILKQGDRVLVVNRRLYQQDNFRFFAGIVNDYEGGIVEAVGHTFVRDAMTGKHTKRSDERTRILSVASGNLLVFKLPDSVLIESLAILTRGSQITLTDYEKYQMDLSEFAETTMT